MLTDIFDKHNLSVAEIAKATGINRATLYNWSRNPKSINFYGSYLIVQALQAKNITISIDELGGALFDTFTHEQLEVLPIALDTIDFIL